MSDSSQITNAPPPALVSALRRLLRPLVRLLLEHQITYPYLADLLKTVFVELAEQDFTLEGKRQTTSRVSLLTGIHRKDVKRLRETPRDADGPPAVVSLGAQLVARWIGVADYLNSDGRARPLRRRGADDAGPGFEQLVASVSKDIRARAVLDEWIRLGVAHLDNDDRVVLNVDAFVPKRGFEEKAFYFGRNLHDHMSAAAQNLAGSARPFLERSVYYDRLSPESVRKLRELSERTGMQALQEVNRAALALQEADRGRSDALHRVNFGIYCYDEREDTDD